MPNDSPLIEHYPPGHVNLYQADNLDQLVSYMSEMNWFCDPVYVVWFHGCTDGWPQCIFTTEEAAIKFVSVRRLNPEGYSIQKVHFGELVKKAYVHYRQMELKVEARIECYDLGYPGSEARYLSIEEWETAHEDEGMTWKGYCRERGLEI